MINRRVMRAATLAATLAAAVSSGPAAAQACDCTHQGSSVACPANLPPGSQSIQFVPGGTLWLTPQGQQVFVPQATFPACTTKTPTPPPAQPPTKPPVQTPATPPVQTPQTPPVDTPKTPPVGPPTQRPPIAPPTDGGRSNEDRARRSIEPPPPPIVVVPPTPDDGKTTDELIRRLGEEVRNQDKPGVPPPQPAAGEPSPSGKSPPPGTANTPAPTTPEGDTSTTQNVAQACPQRGRGCVALLLNFRTYAFANGLNDSEEPDELGAVANLLNLLHCETVQVEPDIKRTTSYSRNYYLGIAGHGYHYTSQIDPKGDEIEHNKKEIEKINAEVAKHRETVKSKKPEIAIEMISAHGHGSDLAQGDTFGWWSPHTEWYRNHLVRGSFHSGNYEAAKENVCQWFVYDSSCFAGLSPRAFDTLNNVGTATYSDKATDKCGLHAAYESDIAVATATTDTCALLADGPKLVEDTIVLALRTVMAHRTDATFGRTSSPEPKFIELVKGPSKEKFPSWYSDQGYQHKDRDCPTADRKGYDFSTKPMPPP
jgi:hypothetical protein